MPGKKPLSELLPEGWIGLNDIDGTVITNGRMTIRCRNDGSAEVDLDGKITMTKEAFEPDSELDRLIRVLSK